MKKYIQNFKAPPSDDEKITRFIHSCREQFIKIALAINVMLDGSATWNPGSIADGDEEAKEVTVTGAELGDFVIASFSLDVADLVLNAQVTAADTVTCILANNTGGAIDLGEGIVYVRVIRK